MLGITLFLAVLEELERGESESEVSHSVVSDSCDPMEYSLPGSSVHGISQARVLEWVLISFSEGSCRWGVKLNLNLELD